MAAFLVLALFTWLTPTHPPEISLDVISSRKPSLAPPLTSWHFGTLPCAPQAPSESTYWQLTSPLPSQCPGHNPPHLWIRIWLVYFVNLTLEPFQCFL